MAHIEIIAGVTASELISTLNANYIPSDQFELEGVYVYPAGGFLDSAPAINTAFASNNCVKLYGNYNLSTTIIIPANKVLILLQGTVVTVMSDVDGVQLKSGSQIIGNNCSINSGIAGYTHSLVWMNPADALFLPKVSGLKLSGIADYKGNGISMSHASGYTGSGTITFADINDCYFNFLEKAINIDMGIGDGWINCSNIRNVFISGSVYGIYMGNGGFGYVTREIRNTIVSNMIMQASTHTYVCTYLDCMEAEIKMRTLDTPIGAYAVLIPASGINNQITSDTLNPVYDGGLYNVIVTNSLLEKLATHIVSDGPFYNENPVCWLDASLEVIGDPVSSWGDKSPYENDATEAINKPDFVDGVINSLPVIRASGTELLTLTNPITLSRNGAAIMMVIKASTLDATERCILGDSDKLSFTNVATSTIQMTPNGGTDWVLKANAGIVTTDFFILDISADAGTVLCYMNNSFLSTKTPDADFIVNKIFDPSFVGDIAEIMIYRTKRTADQRLLDYNYVKTKYDL